MRAVVTSRQPRESTGKGSPADKRADLRRILFYRALLESDPRGNYLNEPLLATMAENGAANAEVPLQERLATALIGLEQRLDRRHGTHLHHHHAGGLPLIPLCVATFLLALTTNYLGPSDHINLLLNPMTALLLWNLTVYLLLAGRQAWPKRASATGHTPLAARLGRWQKRLAPGA